MDLTSNDDNIEQTKNEDDLRQEWLIDGSSWEDMDLVEILDISARSEDAEPADERQSLPETAPRKRSRQHHRSWWLVGILVSAAASEAFGQLFTKLFALLS